MIKLTDLDLCKRIAEIEGYDDSHIDVTNSDVWVLDGHAGTEFNPLTNKALLFDLMVKHNVCMARHPQSPKYIVAYCMVTGVYGAKSGPEVTTIEDELIPRAILECIVEANK